MMLITLTMIGSALGATGGIISAGFDGLILGAAIGFVTGASIWSLVSMSAQWQHERRFNQYFNSIIQDETD